MITHLRGQIIYKDSGFAVIETCGVGYKVAVTRDTMSEIVKFDEKPVSLWTYLAVRENSQDIYGFLTRDELDFFELLISISGIGPKTALGVLNASSIENLKQAIFSGETSYLTKISGIGRKLAEKIVFELREKVGGSEGGAFSVKGDSDVSEALQSLGYNEREAREAVKKLPKDVTGTSNRVKTALKMLGK